MLIRRRLKRLWNLENSHGESHGLHNTGWRDQKYRERRPQLRLSTQSVVGVTHLTPTPHAPGAAQWKGLGGRA